MRYWSFFFFFFQAEDGIRDDLVTGVQTCALPISQPRQAAHQVRGLKPDVQLDVAALKYGAHGHGKFALAGAAAAHAHTDALHIRDAIKTATTGAMRPLRPHDTL